MKKNIYFLIIALIPCLFTSCGYRFGQGSLPNQYSSISVPYVKGDFDGDLTASIVRQIARSGSFQYSSDGGELTLIVKIVDFSDENIGFRYNRKKRGKLTDTVVPVETRITNTVEVVVVETGSGSTILGPVRLSAYVDFDHDYYSSQNGVNVFSLGQLTDVDEAFDAVQRPLNQLLAQKIVDFISDSW